MSFCLYNKKNITRRLEDMNFIFSWQKQYFTHSLRSFVKYCFGFCHSKIKFISSSHRVISSLYSQEALQLFLLSITNLSVIDRTIPPPSDAKQVCQKDEFNLKEEVVYLILIAFLKRICRPQSPGQYIPFMKQKQNEYVCQR